MLFDENKVIDAQKFTLNAKASIQRNGRLGFTGEAARLLSLQEGLTMLFSESIEKICDGLECDISDVMCFSRKEIRERSNENVFNN